MIFRTYDAELIDRLIDQEMTINFDAKAWIDDRRNFALIDERDNLLMFDFHGHGVYAVHIFFEARGRDALETAKAILREAFKIATTIAALPPVDKKHVCWFCRKLGFRSYGIIDTAGGNCELFIITGDQCRFW